MAIALTRADEVEAAAVARLRQTFGDVPVVPVSVIDDASLAALREAIWQLTGLIAIHLRSAGATDQEPLALHPPATVADVADSIHHDLGSSFAGARVWGPSGRFEGQRVGRDHVVADGDVVEILR